MSPTSRRIHSTEDARRLARRRLPRLVFDFVDGAAGREVGTARNAARFDDILLQSRVMADIAERDLSAGLLGREFGVPFGVAPMGMCNLIHPGADRILAEAGRRLGMPVCLSSAASSTLEDMAGWAGENAWFQLYFNHSTDASLALVDRAEAAGYRTLILTVDVPQVSRRLRDLRNGFAMPFRMTPRSFWDFATHPRWSLSTLLAGVPSPRNYDASASAGFDRGASRAGADWRFLSLLRDRWRGDLVVKGVTSPDDALRIRDHGVDAIYVSNHGARQLDSSAAAIDFLPRIRRAVGPQLPLIYDSGIRNGEDVLKALTLGADFVMLGRPVLFALGAGGRDGLNALLQSLAEDISVAMAQLGVKSIADVGPEALFDAGADGPGAVRAAPLHVAAKT